MKKAKASLKFDRSHPNRYGQIPVVLRVYSPAHKSNKDYVTGELRHPDDPESGQFSGISTGALNKAHGVIDRLHVNGYGFDFGAFESQFLNRASGVSINKFIEDRVKDIRELGKNTGTYEDLRKRLEGFRGENILLASINKPFITKFTSHLAKTNSKNSINMYLRTLKAIWNDAKEDHGLIPEFTKSPFKGLKIQSEPTFKRYLTKDEMDKIMAFNGSIPRSFYKDSRMMFNFSYLCNGMNPGDMFALKLNDVSGNTVTYRRSKTGDMIRISITDGIQEILDYYGDGNSPYIFPVYKDLDLGTMSTGEVKKIKNNWSRTIAKNIRMITKKVNLNDHDIDAYTARHTFASHYLLYDDNPSIFRLMMLMGHSSEKATRFYISTLKLDIDMNRL